MFVKKSIVALFVVAVCGSVVIAADDTATTRPTEAKHAGHHGHLIKPYSELTGLTAEQTAQIEKIHAETLKEEKALKAKEESAIDALLTDDQKAQLKTLESEPKMPKHKQEVPTTEPAK